jgi:micrococcal nuclease
MKKKLSILLVFIFLLACTTAKNKPLPTLVATAIPLSTLPASLSDTTPLLLSGQTAVVTHIVDGDTIDVDLAGSIYRVRYIGMDTPERGDFFYHEATEANRQLAEGQTVTMVKDVSETDRYGRLLRYVYLPDGTFVNAELVKQGYAQIATYPPDVKYQELFAQLQQEARNAGLGLWGDVAVTSVPVEVLLPTITAVFATLPPSTNCDPAYPTVCIPPRPPDLDCGSISYQDFQVLEPDPHGFDRDNDGIGCES